MKQRTCCIVVDNDRVLLGVKKEGFGKGNLNGFGGKIAPGESIEVAAKRELEEESSMSANTIKKCGECTFIWPHAQDLNTQLHIFIATATGIPKETAEMKPEWFEKKSVPFDRMWEADKFWLPLVLEGKHVMCEFTYNEDKKIIAKKIEAQLKL